VRRREFIKIVAGSAAAWPLAARAQPTGPVRLIGVLMDYAESDPVSEALIAVFRDELAKLGWKEGGNLRIEVRWSAGSADRVRTFAKELVNLRPDAILGRGTPETIALARETRTIPIVFAAASDPIGNGFVASLTHPGGNISGFTNVESTVGGKWVGLLREIAPRTTHVAVLFNPATAPPVQFYMPSIQAAAASFAIRASTAPVHTTDGIEGVITTLARDPGGGLIMMPDTFNVTNRELILALAARYGVPVVSNNPIFAKSSCLITYGVDFAELVRQAAGYIARILKGESPADLPVQNPTKFNLAVNLKTAKALGLDVPVHLQQIADEVIE
jgi:putative tryptophan/tyrosine transport system substrate-binding protein